MKLVNKIKALQAYNLASERRYDNILARKPDKLTDKCRRMTDKYETVTNTTKIVISITIKGSK